MEINEKLDLFFRATIEAANGKSQEILEEQEKIYQESIAAYEKKKQEQFGTRVRVAENQVEREENRIVSEQILQLKKEYHDKQELWKEELFGLVTKRLEDYRKTEEYKAFLRQKIAAAEKYAGEDTMQIYLDTADANLREELADGAGCEILVSKEPFGGGIRAVIRDRNLLMDESFDRKLAEEKEKFSFNGKHAAE